MKLVTSRLAILGLVLSLAFPGIGSAAGADKSQKARSYDLTGSVGTVSSTHIVINGLTHLLSPVVQVHGLDNKTVLISQLKAGTRIGVKFERLGNIRKVKQIWIMAADEPGVVTGI